MTCIKCGRAMCWAIRWGGGQYRCTKCEYTLVNVGAN